MGKLTFKHEKLKVLLDHAETRWPLGVRTLYKKDTGPGFWLVGDEGVYLMCNGKMTKAKKQKVVYAEECNPDIMPFDKWWAAKNHLFGGDDGADFIDKEIIEKALASGMDLTIELTPKEMRFSLAV